MNIEFRDKFGIDLPLIPLKEAGQVRQGNAARTDWRTICPNDGEEIYLIGNPPYAGAKVQTRDQKADYDYVFGSRPYSRNLDYIALWFDKGGDYIEGTRAELAFVTTNSVSQGEHVGLMFPMLFEKNLEIGFAYTSFKWENNARRNAGVTVAVISLRNTRPGQKHLFTGDLRVEASNINGYLADGPNLFIHRRRSPLSRQLPDLVFGSMPRDGGGLILNEIERARLMAEDARSAKFIRNYVGAEEHINGLARYCLWITDRDAAESRSISGIATRLERVANSRRESKAESTASFALRPHRFVQISHQDQDAILVPAVSSEEREYVPIGYLTSGDVANNRVYVGYGATPWVFGLLTSRMHMVWMRAVSGRLETRISYSNTIVYNNFPVRHIWDAQKDAITEAALRVLDVREYHSEKTLAELYDPDLMPDDLRLAHQELDELVDSVYRKRGFESNEDRLSHLFGMYERMTAEENSK